jgi:acetyl esterase/lipase
MSTSDTGDVVEVTRRIPVPASVSAQARAALAAGNQMARQARSVANPPLDDVEGWRELIRVRNELMLAAFSGRADDTRLTVSTRAVDGVPVFDIVPSDADDSPTAPVYLDIHGGALILGAGDCCREMAKITASRVGVAVRSVDYRMPPDHPYPAALDDCLTVYRDLLATKPASAIVVGGASAGGNLAAALLLRARDEGLPMPAGLVLLSPEADLTESGDSFCTNLGIDTALNGSLADANRLYAGDHDLTDPFVSPLFGSFDGFPPTFLQTGTRDLFLSNTVRMHRRLRAAGVAAELHVFEAMPHGGFWGAPEDDELAAELAGFVSRVV